MKEELKLVYLQNGIRTVVRNPDLRKLQSIVFNIITAPGGAGLLWCIYSDKGVLLEGNTKRYL